MAQATAERLEEDFAKGVVPLCGKHPAGVRCRLERAFHLALHG
jgi:hypothetical protein